MITTNTKLLLYLLPFGFSIYLLDIFCAPRFGMTFCTIISAVLILILLGIYLTTSNRESDERERELGLKADSTTLYIVIASLLAAAIFFPHSQFAMVFWSVLSLATSSRIITFFYQRYK